MSTIEAWAESELEGADLGDQRLSRRARGMLTRMLAGPAGRVTSVFSTSAEQEAAFRFLRNDAVESEELARSSYEATFSRLRPDEDYVVAIDQTSLAVTDRLRTKGMGRIGPDPGELISGFQVMSALVMGTGDAVKGLCAQQWWVRAQDCPSWDQDRRLLEERESILWHRALQEAEESRVSAGMRGRAWYQLDRGADSWHLWERVRNEQLLITVRSAYNRNLADEQGHLHDAVAGSKVVGGIQVRLGCSNAKRAGHAPGRVRRLTLRAKQVCVEIQRTKPHKGKIRLGLWVVHVRETRPPRKSERIEWFLLTTYPVRRFTDALKVVQNYRSRWRIEEFHKTWKTSACNIETSQLRSSGTFRKWATLHAIVASRIEQMKRLARGTPEASAEEIASRHEIDTLIILAHKKKLVPAKRLKWKPGDFMCAEDFVHLVATMGGYTGRTSSGGPPGSITIRRGLERLLPAVDALEAAGVLAKL